MKPATASTEKASFPNHSLHPIPNIQAVLNQTHSDPPPLPILKRLCSGLAPSAFPTFFPPLSQSYLIFFLPTCVCLKSFHLFCLILFSVLLCLLKLSYFNFIFHFLFLNHFTHTTTFPTLVS